MMKGMNIAQCNLIRNRATAMLREYSMLRLDWIFHREVKVLLHVGLFLLYQQITRRTNATRRSLLVPSCSQLVPDSFD